VPGHGLSISRGALSSQPQRGSADGRVAIGAWMGHLFAPACAAAVAAAAALPAGAHEQMTPGALAAPARAGAHISASRVYFDDRPRGVALTVDGGRIDSVSVGCGSITWESSARVPIGADRRFIFRGRAFAVSRAGNLTRPSTAMAVFGAFTPAGPVTGTARVARCAIRYSARRIPGPEPVGTSPCTATTCTAWAVQRRDGHSRCGVDDIAAALGVPSGVTGAWTVVPLPGVSGGGGDAGAACPAVTLCVVARLERSTRRRARGVVRPPSGRPASRTASGRYSCCRRCRARR
jgi:hypothetical protein